MKINLLAIAIILLSMSCNSNDQAGSSTITVMDSTSSEDSISVDTDANLLTENAITTLNNSGFSKYAKEKSPEFEWKKFKLVRFYTKDALITEKFAPDKTYYSSYGAFLKYAPDSSKFIDLDSYNIDIRKSKKGELLGFSQGPDMEVSLIDLTKKEKKRLLFLGPGNSIEDATWLDNDNLLLIGTAADSSGKIAIPTVWKFNVPDQTFYVYETNDEQVARNLKGYWKNERLRSVIIQ